MSLFPSYSLTFLFRSCLTGNAGGNAGSGGERQWPGPPGTVHQLPLPPSAARAVFGVPLENALSIAQIANLPAIVFRCIEYLEAKKADQEEGIYRLSGSSAVIKNLKDRFNAGELSQG